VSVSRISWPLPHWRRAPRITVDPLIQEARDRQRRRRRRLFLVAVAIAAAGALSYGGYRWNGGGRGSAPPGIQGAGLTVRGIGSLRFGLDKGQTIAVLERLFGPPIAQGINTGCGARFTEAVWGALAVEFRSNRFSGYRYVAGGFPLQTPGSPKEKEQISVTPALKTATGVSLYSTLGQLHRAYGRLKRTGADWWQAPNGLLFMDNALRDPVPPTSKIVEIKIGTCGDF
jgi:hypothetical protein